MYYKIRCNYGIVVCGQSKL